MLSLSTVTAERIGYYLSIAQEDYYTKGLEPPGTWFGPGAERLGLRGEVAQDQFRPLLAGFSPDGHGPLVQNAGHTNRQCGWDLTFSAPKSVSVLWALGPPEVRSAIEAAHRQAVEACLAYVQQHCAATRRGPRGTSREPALLAFALFDHGTSRAQDPLLHTHATLLNLGLRQDGTTGTIESRPIFRAKMLIGHRYQMELAAGLRHRLPLTLEPERVGFHVVGVPHELCRVFSQRRQAIERHLQKRGLQGALAAKAATLATRPKKIAVSREELQAQWEERAAAWGWSAEHARRLIQPGAQHQASGTEHRFVTEIRQAIAALPEGQRSPRRVLREVTQLAVRHGTDAQTVLNALQTVCHQDA